MNKWALVAVAFALGCSEASAQFTNAGPDPRDGSYKQYVPPDPTQVVFFIETLERSPADIDAAQQIADLQARQGAGISAAEHDKLQAQIERLLNRGRCSMTGQAAILEDGQGRWNSPSPTPTYHDGATVEISSGHSQKVSRLEIGDFILIPNAAKGTTSWNPSVINEISRPDWWFDVAAAARQQSNPQQPPTASVPRDLPDASGSGFFITENGLFITNHHVIEDHRRISVKTSQGILRATVVHDDPVNDLAVLKIEGKFTSLYVHGSGDLKLAQPVSTVGYPNVALQGSAAKYTEGTIAALSGFDDDPTNIQISVPVQPGNSGGPLVDSQGRVVGVVVAQLSKIRTLERTGHLPENVNYAVKGTILLSLLESVAGWKEHRTPELTTPPKDQMAVAALVQQATGLVMVER